MKIPPLDSRLVAEIFLCAAFISTVYLLSGLTEINVRKTREIAQLQREQQENAVMLKKVREGVDKLKTITQTLTNYINARSSWGYGNDAVTNYGTNYETKNP